MCASMGVDNYEFRFGIPLGHIVQENQATQQLCSLHPWAEPFSAAYRDVRDIPHERSKTLSHPEPSQVCDEGKLLVW